MNTNNKFIPTDKEIIPSASLQRSLKRSYKASSSNDRTTSTAAPVAAPSQPESQNIFVRFILYIISILQWFANYIAYTTFDIIMRSIISAFIQIIIFAALAATLIILIRFQ